MDKSLNWNWLEVIDDIMDFFNEYVAKYAHDEEMSDLYNDCIKELDTIKYSPIALRDEDYYDLAILFHAVPNDGVYEQVLTDVLTPLKMITDHIKEDLG